jgi:hypothetical protein
MGVKDNDHAHTMMIFALNYQIGTQQLMQQQQAVSSGLVAWELLFQCKEDRLQQDGIHRNAHVLDAIRLRTYINMHII